MSSNETPHSTESAEHEPHPSMYEMTREDFLALVRFHGANDVIDAVLAVAVDVYGDMERALPKVHESLLRRAGAMRQSPAEGGAR